MARDGLKFLNVVFARNLGMNCFAFAESETLGRDRDRLRAQAQQLHFDATEILIVLRVMTKAVQVKIAAQLPIDARQDIHVERGGHARRVVIRRVQCGRVFF